MFHTLNIALFSTTHSTHTIITMQDVCLDMGHLCCATILYSYPLFPCRRRSFFRTAVPHKRGGGAGGKAALGMRSSLSQLSIPCCAKFYKLSHRQVVTIVRAAHHPLLGEQGCVTMDTCVYLCVRPE